MKLKFVLFHNKEKKSKRENLLYSKVFFFLSEWALTIINFLVPWMCHFYYIRCCQWLSFRNGLGLNLSRLNFAYIQLISDNFSWTRTFWNWTIYKIFQDKVVHPKLTNNLAAIPNESFQWSTRILKCIYLMHYHWIQSLEMQYLLDFVRRGLDLMVLAVFEMFLGCLFAFVTWFVLCS